LAIQKASISLIIIILVINCKIDDQSASAVQI